VSSNPTYLTPPSEQEERYSYRPVWRSIIIESSLLAIVTLVIWILLSQLNIILPDLVTQVMTPLVVLLPIILWLVFSWIPERRVTQPRQHLLLLCVVSGLTAQAITIPLIEQVFQTDRWLALSPAINRIAGYAVTIGISQELTKYLITRYIVWPHQIRNRYDTLAYCVATAVGATVVSNLAIWLGEPNITLESIAFRVLANFSIQMVGSLLISYALSELQFGNPNIVLLPFTFILAIIIIGIAIPIRAGLVNSVFTLNGISIPRSIFGIGFSIVLLSVPMIIVGFLHENAERLSREAFGTKEN
jgi:hypothetical protein